MNWLQKTAMFVHGEGDHVIAYQSRVFLIDPHTQDTDNPVVRQMANFLGTTTRDLVHDYPSTWEYMMQLREQRPDILLGTVDNGTLNLQSESFQHGAGSRLLQNVMKVLSISNVEYHNEEGAYNQLSNWQVEGNLPEFLYHGTSSEYATRILRFGLQAGESTSNYPGGGPHGSITHEDIVFLAEDINKAAYHALNAVGHQKGFPVVFRFKIPDPSLLVSDYDVETMYDWDYEGNIYTNTYKAPREDYDASIQEEPFNFSKKVGVMGYRGRIPANFIVDIMIKIEGAHNKFRDYSEEDWVSVTSAQLEQALDFGDPAAYAYEDEEFEEDDFEDETLVASNNWLYKTASIELMYHGTSDSLAPKILSEGLAPGRDLVWDSQRAKNDQRSRESYGGIYFTNNFMTTWGAARTATEQFSGSRLMTISQLELRSDSILEDEDQQDNPLGTFNQVLGVNANDFFYCQWAANNFYNLDQITDKYLDKISLDPSGEPKPGFEDPRQREALSPYVTDFIKASVMREIAIAVEQERGSQFPSLSLKYKYPQFQEMQVSKAEADYRQASNALMEKTRFMTNNIKSFMHNVRSMEPVSFRGSNKIVLIARIHESTYDSSTRTNNYIDDKYNDDAEILYVSNPEAIQMLARDMTEKIGGGIRVRDKSGKVYFDQPRTDR